MPVREIAIIDLWTDTNRGDNALQLALVDMLRRRHPGARIAGVFRFGTNEIDDAGPEIASTSAVLDEVSGGIRRTDYSEPNVGRRSAAPHRIVSLLSFLEAYLCTCAFRLLGRRATPLIGRARHRSLALVRQADLVVWKGKNFRDYEGLTTVTRSLTLCGAGWFASLLRDRITCVNASFWPVRGPVQRSIYRRAFRRCPLVTVRDPSSVANAEALLGARSSVRLCPDLSFAILGDPATDHGVQRTQEPVWDVALTVTAWGGSERQRRYLESVVASLARLHELGAQRLVVVPQVTRAAEDSSDLVRALVERLRAVGAAVDVIDGAQTISGLLSTYARCRMLLGARMHSCVFARSVGTPFVALAYDFGPKWEVLAGFWDADLLLPYGTDAATVTAACERVWRDGDALVAASEEAWRAGVRDADENVGDLHG